MCDMCDGRGTEMCCDPICIQRHVGGRPTVTVLCVVLRAVLCAVLCAVLGVV
jgi:putative effector of murein hydrolase